MNGNGNGNGNGPGPDASLCGNGVVDDTEACDGADLGGQSCGSLGLGAGVLACTSGCILDESGCFALEHCGDGVLDPGEVCDDGNDEPWDGCGDCLITDIRVNSDAVDGVVPDVAVAADGGFVVAWESYEPTNGIFVRRYDRDGHALGDELEIGGTVFSSSRRVKVGMAGDGRFVATWEHSIGPGAYAWRSELRRFDAAGAEVGDGFEVDPAPDCEQGRPDVAMTYDGELVVAFRRDCLPGAGEPSDNVFALRCDGAGTPLGDALPVNTYLPQAQRDPRVAAFSGGFVVVWQSLDQDGDDWGVFGRRFGADGAPLGDERAINTTTAGSQRAPVVAAAPDGRFVVAWESTVGSSGDYDVVVQRFGADGEPAGGALLIDAPVDRDQKKPVVAMAADGRFVVVWNGEDPADDEGAVYAQRFDPTGAPLGAAFRVNVLDEGFQGQAAVAMSPSGSFVVVWASWQEEMPLVMTYDIYMQRYDSEGTPLGVGP